MSAFVVTQDTINRAVAFVRANGPALPPGLVEGASFRDEDTDPWRKLAEGMYALNCEAVDTRYQPGTAEEMSPDGFEYRPMFPGTVIQAIKALSCWLYQCAEGDIPKRSTLYNVMDSIEDDWCHRVVRATPEWHEADWG